MNKLRAGFSCVTINPPLGIGVAGYYVPRFAQGVLDDLQVGALVLCCDREPIALVSVDACGVDAGLIREYAAAVEAATGLPAKNVFLSATHTHTGGLLVPTSAFAADEALIGQYARQVGQAVTQAVRQALEDLRPARMGYIVGYAPDRVEYIRRYKMKDGSTWTCPPINDPNIDGPIATLDRRVNVLRFDREGAPTVVLVNHGLHADTVNGSLLSADWPGWMRRTLAKALDGVECLFFNGAEGDVGSTNVHPAGGDMNDTEISFDNEMKSPGMARFVGRALAGTVLQVYDKVCYTDVESVAVLRREVAVAANLPTPQELVRAREYKSLHDQGRDDQIPYTAMELTTVVAEALRMCRLAEGPKEFILPLTGVRLGKVAMVGIPGEPFTQIGVDIQAIPGWEAILPCALTNGDEGYFPVRSAYEEGGYEARTSPYGAGVAEALVEGARALLSELSEQGEKSELFSQ